jgi:hypothetical protein
VASRAVNRRRELFKEGERLGLDDLSKGLSCCIEVLILWHDHVGWRRDLYRWSTALLKKVAASGGIETQMRTAKAYFTNCRQHAIKPRSGGWKGFPSVPLPPGSSVMERRRIYHQVSRVSRSLRGPTASVVRSALQEHWDLSQSCFRTSPAIRQKFRKFVRSHFGPSFQGNFGAVGASASFLMGADQGGAAGEIRELTEAYSGREVTWIGLQEAAAALPSFVVGACPKVFDVESCRVRLVDSEARLTGRFVKTQPLVSLLFPFDKDSGLSLEDWEAKREVLFSLAASWESIDLSSSPRCRQVQIEERGFKVRVATPLEAPFRYLLSAVNEGLLSLLEAVPETVNSLHGRAASFLAWHRGKLRSAVFSADLRSATDRFPQDLMSDAVDVLSEEWPSEMRALALRAVAPHLMTRSPLLGGPRRALTRRGILMGSPISWPLLAIYSTWLHFESGSDGWFGVCGDDYIGCHSRASFKKYLRLRRMTGALGSPGKDIMGFEGVGVFAEDLVSVMRRRVVPTCSIRAVLGDPKSGLPAWTQGPEVAKALEGFAPMARLHRLCSVVHSRQVRLLRQNGIDPFAPRWIGGGGFPGICTRPTARLARIAVSQRREDVVRWTTSFAACWQPLSGSGLLSAAVEEDINRHSDFEVETSVKGQWGPLRDIVSSRMGQLAWSFTLAGIVGVNRRLGLTDVASKIRLTKEEITSKGWWLGGQRIKDGDGIRYRLEKLEPKSKPIPFPPLSVSVLFCGPAPFKRLPRRKRSGPGSEGWGDRRRARLEVNPK